MLRMNDITAANLSQDELQEIMDLEKSINQKHQGNSEVYLIAFEKK